MTKSITINNTGFLQLLFLVFLILKLTHVIDWSWWLVTSPLWGGMGVILFLVIILAIIKPLLK